MSSCHAESIVCINPTPIYHVRSWADGLSPDCSASQLTYHLCPSNQADGMQGRTVWHVLFYEPFGRHRKKSLDRVEQKDFARALMALKARLGESYPHLLTFDALDQACALPDILICNTYVQHDPFL